MADTINVRDLPEEDVELLERWVERLRAKVKRQRLAQRERREESNFYYMAARRKGETYPRGIYDYL